MSDKLIEARAAFVAMIKEENFYSDFSKQSLKAHWNGAASGFSDHMLQRRWYDYFAGYKAAKSDNHSELACVEKCEQYLASTKQGSICGLRQKAEAR